ncbi:hypothetical protein ABEB36_006157 [Hypothenemus hampei]|uniref:Uncharacterized protein n=1 Tax=Hypothenemus hampei TaxID=57062 RepID=A0ABD1F0S6_HYPHA
MANNNFINNMLLLDTKDSSSEEESNAACDDAIAIIGTNQKEKPRYWLSNHIKSRKEKGEFRLFYDLTDEKFTNYFRMNKNKFFELHDLIKDDIKKKIQHIEKAFAR